MKTLGFVNQKGGVGKSFAAKVAANALSGSQHKKRVLLIDCDEQATSVALRRRDFAEQDEFRYEIASCVPADLPAVMAGRKPFRIVTQSGLVDLNFNEDCYDYAIVDMPGRGQSKDISGLLACLDYAVIVVKGDDIERVFFV